jgi:hypothetical protein
MSAVLRLAETDPVAVAIRDIAAGERLSVGGVTVTVARDVALGHKIALRPIATGERVEKYRVPIGIATSAIAPGDHVHTHNLRSLYTPTYTLEAGHRFGEQG